MVRLHAVLVLALCLSCGPRRDDPRASAVDESLQLVAATVAEGGGEMQVKRGAQLQWLSASVGTAFMNGDWLRTGPRGYVRVEYVRGGRLELEEKAMVLIELSNDTGPGADRESQVALEVGTLGGQLDGKGKAVVIRSKAKTNARLQSASDVPLDYRLSRKESSTEVAVRSGEAILEVAGKRRSIKAGEASEIRDDEVVAEVVSLLPAPQLLRPSQQSHFVFEQNVAIPLSWSAVGKARAYRVQVARDGSFRQQVLDLQQPELNTPLLPSDVGPYHWRVAAQDQAGRWGDYGPSRVLFVDREQLVDRLQSPNDGAVIGFLTTPPSLTFAWEPISGAQGYHLVVSKNADLSAPVADESPTDARKDLVLPPGSYYWGVYALGEVPTPLFQQPRTLVVKKVDQAKMKIPKTLEQWGD